MRKSTLLWLFLAVCCGAVLFQTSQKVTDGRERLAILKTQTAREEESLRVLQAEWSYLNQPERLEKLSKQHLGLAPMRGRQFAKLDDIGQPTPEAAAPALKLVQAVEKISKETSAPSPFPPHITKAVTVAAAPKAPLKALPTPKPASKTVPRETRDQASSREFGPREFGDVIESLGVR